MVLVTIDVGRRESRTFWAWLPVAETLVRKEDIRIALMSRFDALGTAEIVRGLTGSGARGKSRLKTEFCNNAH